MNFSNFLNLERILKKNRWFTETAPSGFGKPTGLPPVFTGFVNHGGGSWLSAACARPSPGRASSAPRYSEIQGSFCWTSDADAIPAICSFNF
jgi:hypothetical protein